MQHDYQWVTSAYISIQYPILISAISLFVSVISLLITLRVTFTTLANQNKYSHINYVLELNKKMIDDPVLLSIYDEKHPIISTVENKIVVEAKKEAFCLYLLNLYEIIFDHYKINKSYLNKTSQREWAAWESTIENMINCSEKFRSIATNPEIQAEYSDEFILFMKTRFLSKL